MAMPAGWKPDPVKAALGEEKVLWKHEVDEGFLRRNITDTYVITNHRVIRNYSSVPLQLVDEIILMDRRRSSDVSGVSESDPGFRGASPGSERLDRREIEYTSEVRDIGDIVFMSGGKIAIKFEDVADPEGVAALARAARDSAIQALKSVPAGKKHAEIICPDCKASNSSGMKFCNSCGRSLANVCPRCSKTSPEGSAFCGHCGAAMQ